MPDTPTELLFVIANTEYGGGQRTFEVLASALRDRGFSLHVACDANEPLWARMGALGVCRHEVRFDRTWGPFRVIQLASIIQKERIQLVHSQSRRADFYALMAARLCRVPIISHVAVRAESFDIGGLRKRLYRSVEAWMEHRFSVQIAVSSAIERALLSAGLPRERVVRIPEAIETERFPLTGVSKAEACRRLGIDAQRLWVGALGRMIPLKGHRLFLEAAGELRGLSHLGFLLAGTGPLEGELKALAQRLKLGGRLHILPFQEDPTAFYSALDLLVFPSLFGEGFPRVLLEAMLFGKPIIASDLPACKEVLGTGPFVKFFPSGNAEALASAIREFCQDPVHLGSLGAVARQYVADHYDIRRVIPRVTEVYRSVLHAPSQGPAGEVAWRTPPVP